MKHFLIVLVVVLTACEYETNNTNDNHNSNSDMNSQTSINYECEMRILEEASNPGDSLLIFDVVMNENPPCMHVKCFGCDSLKKADGDAYNAFAGGGSTFEVITLIGEDCDQISFDTLGRLTYTMPK